MFSFDYENESFTNVNVDSVQTTKYRHRRSLDYGTTSFNLAGPNKLKPLIITRHNSIPNSPLHFINNSNSATPTPIPKSKIFIRRQSSEKCLQKRHSVDSNNSNSSDPGYSSINNKTFLSPSQLRSARESNSPKSCHSSNVSVTGRNSSYSSMAFLSRQSSTNSSKHPAQRESEENLQGNKWFSSSSVILTRVKSMKEKFRRVVVQSVQPDDWPPPSVLFSDRYKCPSNTSFQSANFNSNIKNHPKMLVKSKSIDHSSFQTTALTTKKNLRNSSPAGSGRNKKRERLQRSLTSYSESIDYSNNGENGIVCSDMDLKAIISMFKREEATYSKYNSTSITEEKMKPTQNVSKTPIGTSSVIGPGFGKRKLMRKQVSFDDEQGILMMNRKVSAIAEEIECHATSEHNLIERQPTLIGTSVDENNVSKSQEQDQEKERNNNDKDNVMSEDEDENCAPYEISLLPKDVEFDEYGQTWEIYGADPDPEILGQAIQHHLERLMVCRPVINVPNGNVSRPELDSKINCLEEKIKTEDNNISMRLFKPLRVDLESSENNLSFFASRLCGKWSCFASGNQESGNKVITSIDQNH